MLSSEIFFRAQPPSGLPQYGEISALVVSFLALLLILSAVYQRQLRRSQRFVTVTGRGYRAREFSLGRWRWVAAGGAGLYFFLAVLAPLGILTWTSLLPFYSGVSADMLSELSLRNHKILFSNPRVLEAAWNSVIIAVVSASVVAALSALVSWVVVRSKAPGRRMLDVLAFLPLAIPSTMIGLALIYVYLTLQFIPIYGTIWIIALACITVYLSFGTRTMNGVMLQMHAELEEAAQTSGASWARTFRRITVPLMRPALLAVWIWVAAHALRELSFALMLQGRSNVVVPTLLWGYWEGGRPTIAAAAGVWLIVALFLLVLFWDRLTGDGNTKMGG